MDKEKNPVDVYFKESLPTNHLIEEFMLLANKTVAKHVGSPKKEVKNFVYRVHETPDDDKITILNSKLKLKVQSSHLPLYPRVVDLE